jgi:hypothetical protein
MTYPDPISVYGQIREAYLRYVDTAYWLRDPVVMRERRSLLEGGNLLFTDILIEPVLPYVADVPLRTRFGPCSTKWGLVSASVGSSAMPCFVTSRPTAQHTR